MVETSRSSSSSKSFSSSSSSPEPSSHLHALPSDLRSRSMLLFNLGGGTGGVFVGERAMDAEKPVLTDMPVMEISLEADVVVTPIIAGEVVTDGEK
ncbi:hypothetical protein YC2023_058775 [Brassica napus]